MTRFPIIVWSDGGKEAAVFCRTEDGTDDYQLKLWRSKKVILSTPRFWEKLLDEEWV